MKEHRRLDNILGLAVILTLIIAPVVGVATLVIEYQSPTRPIGHPFNTLPILRGGTCDELRILAFDDNQTMHETNAGNINAQVIADAHADFLLAQQVLSEKGCPQ